MAQQPLYDGDLDARLHQMSGKAVPQAVDAAFVGQPGPLLGGVENLLAGGQRQRLVLVAPEEEPLFGAEHTVVVAQRFQKSGGKEGVAGFLSFSLLAPGLAARER